MESLEQIKTRAAVAVPGAGLEIIPNDSPAGQLSLSVNPEQALAVAEFLRLDPLLKLDYCSNVTGVDWPETELTEKVKVRKVVEGVEKEVEEVKKSVRPGFLEVVYHLYSMEHKHGPVILRVRTKDRTGQTQVPSLTPAWRSCELQEREVFDLFGVDFVGHPDLRRILMWDGYQDHPMRKDFVEPDDYDYEPTPHDAVLEKAKRRRNSPAGSD